MQAQVRERYATLTDLLKKPDASSAERGAAYGALAMLLHASEYFDAAEPAYRNAQILMPEEPRWPYFLGHLHKSVGDTAKSIAAFSRVLELRPNDVSTLIWLGRMYVDQGQADRAEPLFARARTFAPQTAAVLVGLGQTALARKDFATAVKVLEEALSIDPAVTSVHSPLAMAYRGLGDTKQAEAHLKLWHNTEVLVPDPWKQELDLALNSSLSYELRGVRALEERDFKAAADFFRKGVALTNGETTLGRSLRHKLGTALFLSGDVRGAVERFEETVRYAPATGLDDSAAKAHYSLGVLMASSGRSEESITHLSAAARYNPNYVEALLALGDALRRSGRDAAALSRYEEVLSINTRVEEARFGYAMALVRLRRYAEARDRLTEAAALHPDRAEFRHALARVLAAAPDDTVRNGPRSLMLAKELFTNDQKTTEIGETMAMSLAEVGQYDDAVGIQRGVIQAASRSGQTAAVRQMAANLRLYERRQPCRTPWPDDDPVYSPGPPVNPELAAALRR